MVFLDPFYVTLRLPNESYPAHIFKTLTYQDNIVHFSPDNWAQDAKVFFIFVFILKSCKGTVCIASENHLIRGAVFTGFVIHHCTERKSPIKNPDSESEIIALMKSENSYSRIILEYKEKTHK